MREFMQNIEKDFEKSPIVDFKWHAIEMGLAIIQRCAFGKHEPLGENQYLKTVFKVFDFEEVCGSWLDSFFAATHDFVKFTHYLYIGTFLTNSTLDERDKERIEGKNINRQPDFLDYLRDSEVDPAEIMDKQKSTLDTKVQKNLTREELQAQCIMFLIAGSDTTANATQYCLYELAKHPEEQEKVFEEIELNINGEEEITYTTMQSMRQLDWFIKETLRHHPLVQTTNGIARRAMENTTIGNGIRVDKNVCVAPNILSIHFDKTLWGEDADEFHPDRFSPEESEGRHPMAWLPFGAGPRICVGMRFAMQEVKMALIYVLMKYKLEMAPEFQLNSFGLVIIKPDSLKLQLVERK
uniref:Cytochrome P450 n=1 Tax=Acrobeloides nanus TaxID=290746 RepID=A0A914CFV2_9BILA